VPITKGGSQWGPGNMSQRGEKGKGGIIIYRWPIAQRVDKPS
jgi:hypothetical protein